MSRPHEIALLLRALPALIWTWLKAKLRGEHYEPPDFG